MSQFDSLLDFGDNPQTQTAPADPFSSLGANQNENAGGGGALLDLGFDLEVSSPQNGSSGKVNLQANTNPLYELSNSSPDIMASEPQNPLFEISSEPQPQKSSNPLYDYMENEHANGHGDGLSNGSHGDDLLGMSATVTSDDSGVTMDTNVNVSAGESFQEELVVDEREPESAESEARDQPAQTDTEQVEQQEAPAPVLGTQPESTGSQQEEDQEPETNGQAEEEAVAEGVPAERGSERDEDIVQEERAGSPQLVSVEDTGPASQEDVGPAGVAVEEPCQPAEAAEQETSPAATGEQQIPVVEITPTEPEPELEAEEEDEKRTEEKEEPAPATAVEAEPDQKEEEEITAVPVTEVQAEPQESEQVLVEEEPQVESQPEPVEEAAVVEEAPVEEILPEEKPTETPVPDEAVVAEELVPVETAQEPEEEAAVAQPAEEPVVAGDQELAEPAVEQSQVVEGEPAVAAAETSEEPAAPAPEVAEEQKEPLEEEEEKTDSMPEFAETEPAPDEGGVKVNGTNDMTVNGLDAEPERDPNVIREDGQKEEVPSFDQMSSFREKFETGGPSEDGEAKKFSIQDEVAEGGEYESTPVVDPDVVRESDKKDIGEELPEVGTAKNLLQRFQQIQEDQAKPQTGKRPSPPREGTQVEYVSEPTSRTEQYQGKVETGVFESSPEELEGVVRHGEKTEDVPLPEKGHAKNLAQMYKDIEVESSKAVTSSKRELTPDRSGKVEYVSEPTSSMEHYEGKPDHGVFESQPQGEEGVVKSGEATEDVLPESGTAKSLLSKFKQMETEVQNKPPPSPKRELVTDRTSKTEFVSEPRGYLEKYEPQSESGVFESKPVNYEEVVRSEEEVPDVLPEEGTTKKTMERFKEIQRQTSSPVSKGKKEFTPPPEGTAVGVLESTPVEREGVVKSSDVAEDDLPERGTAKSLANKFKQFESQTIPSPTRGKKEFTPPPEAGVYESTPDESLVIKPVKAESGTLESTPEARSDDVAREDRTDPEVELPERGFAKNLVSKFRQMESESAKNSSSSSPKFYKEFTPPRDARGVLSPKSPAGATNGVDLRDLPGQYQQQTQAGVFENEPELLPDVAREGAPNYEEELPKANAAKSMLEKFRNIQEKAKEDQETPKPVSRKDSPTKKKKEDSPPPTQDPERRFRHSVESGVRFRSTFFTSISLPTAASVFRHSGPGTPTVTQPATVSMYRHGGPITQTVAQPASVSVYRHGGPITQTKPFKVYEKERGMFKAVETEKCAACQKTVYAMEKLEMNKNVYHRSCFKCSHCSARLTPGTFSINEGVIYCTNHFKQLFARKGNYDEGFGRQQYKKKWQGDEKARSEDESA